MQLRVIQARGTGLSLLLAAAILATDAASRTLAQAPATTGANASVGDVTMVTPSGEAAGYWPR